MHIYLFYSFKVYNDWLNASCQSSKPCPKPRGIMMLDHDEDPAPPPPFSVSGHGRSKQLRLKNVYIIVTL